jgi:hypothetical protein
MQCCAEEVVWKVPQYQLKPLVSSEAADMVNKMSDRSVAVFVIDFAGSCCYQWIQVSR